MRAIAETRGDVRAAFSMSEPSRRSSHSPAAVRARGDYVGGRFRRPRGGPPIESRDPGDTRDLIGVFPTGGTAAVDAAVEAARRAQRAWAELPLARRVAAVRRILRPLALRGEELA